MTRKGKEGGGATNQTAQRCMEAGGKAKKYSGRGIRGYTVEVGEGQAGDLWLASVWDEGGVRGRDVPIIVDSDTAIAHWR